MTLAEVLEAERLRQGLSVQALATAAGVPRSQAYSILRGETPNPGFCTVEKLLAALGRTLTWLDRQRGR